MTISEFINKVGFKVKNEDVQKVNGTISDIKNTATRLLGAIGIGFSLVQVNQMVEEWNRVNNQIKSSTNALGDQQEIQQKILQSAADTRSAYQTTADTISNLVKENAELFGDIDEAVKFNNAATMLFKTAGKTNEEIAGIMEAINKSFAKGYVDSETLSQLLERSPEAIELINKRLGSTSDQLEKLASDGIMTVADLKAAFVDNIDTIEKDFADVKYTVSDALLYVRNKWGFWLADMDETLNVTQAVAKTIKSGFDVAMSVLNRVTTRVEWLSEKLGGAENLMKLVALAAGAIFLAFKFSSIKAGLQTIIGFIGKIKASTLLTSGVILLLVLLVEDFVNFMQGNDSLIGTMFEDLGIDADDARETIKNAWEEVTTFFEKCGETISSVAEKIRDKLGEFNDKIQQGKDWLKDHEQALGLVSIAMGTLTAAIVAYNIAQAIKNAGGIVELAQLAATAIGVGALTVAEVAHSAATAVATAATTAFGAAMTFLTSPITLVILAIGALIAIIYLCVKNWDKIKEVASACWDWIVKIFGKAAGWVYEKIIQPIVGFFTGLFDTVSTTVGNIKNSIVNGFTEAINWIKSLPAQALTWGKDIVLNIVDGINKYIGKISDAAKNVANTIKSFLGFSEPEEGPLSNFHTYMPDMIDLMSKGILDGREKIKDSLGALTGDMAVMARADIVSASTIAAAKGGNSVSKNVSQNVEINNSFYGDRAIQKNASSAMNNSAKDVTAELARGLAVAR